MQSNNSVGDKKEGAIRMPPHNLGAEQAVLGGILIENDAMDRVLDYLSIDGADFYHDGHRAMFRAMVDLWDKYAPIDAVVLADALKDSNALARVGGISYVGELVEATPTAANVTYYAKAVREASVRRRLIHSSTELLARLYDGQSKLDEVLDSAQGELMNLSLTRTNPYTHIGNIIKTVEAQLKTLYENEAGMSGLDTGFAELNALLGGFQRTDFIIIAGRPSMGKSALAAQIGSDLAIRGYHVGYFPVEVGGEQLVKNLLACHGKLNTTRFRDGNFDDLGVLEHTIKTIKNIPFFIDDHARSSADIVRQARKIKREKGLDIIFMDHIQQLTEHGQFFSREDEIRAAATNLKAIAKELNIPVVAVSQLNREVEKRHPPKPRRSDLRDSGALEQLADVIMFLYREDYYNQDTDKPGIAEVMVEKQRNGPTGTVELRWHRQFLRFTNRYEEVFGT